jgi:hypothetical protein
MSNLAQEPSPMAKSPRRIVKAGGREGLGVEPRLAGDFVVTFRGAGVDAGQFDVEGRLRRGRLCRVEAQLAGKALEFAVDRDTHLFVGEVDGAAVGLDLSVFDAVRGKRCGKGDGEGDAFHVSSPWKGRAVCG